MNDMLYIRARPY